MWDGHRLLCVLLGSDTMFKSMNELLVGVPTEPWTAIPNGHLSVGMTGLDPLGTFAF